PFGQNDRTIIRPQPGGRPAAPRPGAPAGAPEGAGPAGTPVAAPVRAPTGRPADAVRTPGSNPLLIAAGPLLDLLGRLRNATTVARFADLKPAVSRAIDGFERAATEAGAYAEQLRHAKYAL